MTISQRTRGRLFGACSILAIGALPASAQAACTPEPNVGSAVTSCTGVDSDGVLISGNAASVFVLPGSLLTNTGAAALSVAISSGDETPFRDATIAVSGTVDGGPQSGIAVTNGSVASGIYGTVSTSVAVTIASDGVVKGGNGISISPTAGNLFAYAMVTLDNAGSIIGTQGAALFSTGSFSRFGTVTNREGGFIGGISADIYKLENAGTIDGGIVSAINDTDFETWVINSGLITSNSALPTLNSGQSFVENTGTITNTGSGSAIGGGSATITNSAGASITAVSGDAVSVTGHLSFDNAGTIASAGQGKALNGLVVSGINREGGIISTGGATAISSGWSLNFANLGEIVGDVYAGTEQRTINSNVDTSQGILRGNLIFGAGDDLLRATYSAERGLVTGVTGTIDGGGGIDTLGIAFATDAVIASPFTLPRNFEDIDLVLADAVTVTLDKGFSLSGGMALSGSGNVVNRADLRGQGAVVRSGSSYGKPSSFTNEGSIISDGAGSTYAVITTSTFVNKGSITSASNGVTGSLDRFQNTGTISAAGTAANIGLTAGFANDGTIRSTGGTALALVGSSSSAGVSGANINNGTIYGALTGVDLSATLVNSGTIASAERAVALGSYSLLYNRAGGSITGTIAATYGSAFNATLTNAGTITGDVSFGTAGGGNRFFAMAGSVLDGNLTLGARDTLALALGQDANSGFGAIKGTVTATDANLRYIVNEDTSATVALPTGFSTLGYDIHGGAALTLTSDTPFGQAMTFAGNGSVTLDLALSYAGQGPILSIGQTLDPLSSLYNPSTSEIAITNAGDISYTRIATSGTTAAIELGDADTFVNTGVLTVANASDNTYWEPIMAVRGGHVINAGTIAVEGGNGIGSVQSLTNIGTITSTGTAVGNTFDGLFNSGTIRSTGGAAIVSDYGGGVYNQAGGIISGRGIAMTLTNATVVNAGTIIGTVDMTGSRYNYSSSNYVDAGGTLNGHLLFGAGDDTFIETGAGVNVTGVIDAGDGFDRIGHQRDHDATVTLGRPLRETFEGEFTIALGRDTQVTLAADTQLDTDIVVAGNGHIINRAQTSGQLISSNAYLSYLEGAGGLTVTNAADVGGGILLSAVSLTNTATVGSRTLTGSAISQYAQETLTFDNAGLVSSQISSTPPIGRTVQLYGEALTSAHIVNSGRIEGNGLAATLLFDGNAPRTASFTNSGTIIGVTGVALGNSFTFDASDGTDAVTHEDLSLAFDIANSGLIQAGNGPALLVRSTGTATVDISNSGIVRTTGSGTVITSTTWGTCESGAACLQQVRQTLPVATISVLPSTQWDLEGAGTVAATITNEADGLIEASGLLSTAIVSEGPLTLVNAGRIAGNGVTDLAADDRFATLYGTSRIAGAIQTRGGGDDSIVNSGTIIGAIDLGAGNDSVVNTGILRGDVFLAGGDDRFVLGLSATLEGVVDGGGAGTDTALADITGGGTLEAGFFSTFMSFERFGVTGSGIVQINSVLPIDTLLIDGGAQLELAAGSRLETTGPVAVTGSDGSQRLVNHGTIAGSVALGGGDDTYVAMAGSVVTGVIDGGAGNDTAIFDLPAAFTLTAGKLTGFERLEAQGNGTLTLDGGAFAFDSIDLSSGLSIASGASVDTRMLTFGQDGGHLAITGGFAGSVTGGKGRGSIEVSGGSASAPVTFGSILDVEAMRLSAGHVTVSGNAALSSLALAGGRLVGLAGSTITAPSITVDSGATFGSAGIVNGNISVAGTLSPGASPGTMTVNGNVALAGSSITVFEISPTVSDRLTINGALSIAPGATLQLVAGQSVRPGQSLDLLTASGGITGSYTNVLRPADLFGFVVQRADRISLMGQFLNDAGFSPQVRGAVDYVNAVLVSGSAPDALLAAVPQLASTSGVTDAAAFARLTPEAYAAAHHIGVDQGLQLAATGRSDAFAGYGDVAGAFTFASALGDTHKLKSSNGGATRTRTSGHGFVGGIGFGNADWSVGAFVGYLDGQQKLSSLAARTDVNGVVGGVHGRWSDGTARVRATVAYSSANASTRRTLPGGNASGDYDLTGWTADMAVDYALSLGKAWSLRPGLGLTAISTTRDAVAETGGSAYALAVARKHDTAVFADAGITLRGGLATQAMVRPYLSLGARYQFEGRAAYATAAMGGGDFGLTAASARRTRLVGTAALGAEVVLAQGLSLFGSLSGEAGDDDTRASANAGVRIAF